MFYQIKSYTCIEEHFTFFPLAITYFFEALFIKFIGMKIYTLENTFLNQKINLFCKNLNTQISQHKYAPTEKEKQCTRVRILCCDKNNINMELSACNVSSRKIKRRKMKGIQTGEVRKRSEGKREGLRKIGNLSLIRKII